MRACILIYPEGGSTYLCQTDNKICDDDGSYYNDENNGITADRHRNAELIQFCAQAGRKDWCSSYFT